MGEMMDAAHRCPIGLFLLTLAHYFYRTFLSPDKVALYRRHGLRLRSTILLDLFLWATPTTPITTWAYKTKPTASYPTTITIEMALPSRCDFSYRRNYIMKPNAKTTASSTATTVITTKTATITGTTTTTTTTITTGNCFTLALCLFEASCLQNAAYGIINNDYNNNPNGNDFALTTLSFSVTTKKYCHGNCEAPCTDL